MKHCPKGLFPLYWKVLLGLNKPSSGRGVQEQQNKTEPAIVGRRFSKKRGSRDEESYVPNVQRVVCIYRDKRRL